MQYADMLFAFAQHQHQLARQEAERRGQLRQPRQARPASASTQRRDLETPSPSRIAATRAFAARLRQRTAATV